MILGKKPAVFIDFYPDYISLEKMASILKKMGLFIYITKDKKGNSNPLCIGTIYTSYEKDKAMLLKTVLFSKGFDDLSYHVTLGTLLQDAMSEHLVL